MGGWRTVNSILGIGQTTIATTQGRGTSQRAAYALARVVSLDWLAHLRLQTYSGFRKGPTCAIWKTCLISPPTAPNHLSHPFSSFSFLLSFSFFSVSLPLYASIGFNHVIPSHTHVYGFPMSRFIFSCRSPIIIPFRPSPCSPGGINQLLQTQLAGFFHVNTVEDPFQESASVNRGALDDRVNAQHG